MQFLTVTHFRIKDFIVKVVIKKDELSFGPEDIPKFTNDMMIGLTYNTIFDIIKDHFKDTLDSIEICNNDGNGCIINLKDDQNDKNKRE